MSPPYPTREILVACALKKELRTVRAGLPGEVQFLHTGLGWKRSQRRLQERVRQRPPAVLVFTGTAGQLSPTLKSGAVVFPRSWCFRDGRSFEPTPELTAFLEPAGFPAAGKGLTVSRPVLRARSRLRLHRETGALACDMESAGVLEASSRMEIPCVAVKVVCDTAESGYWREFNASMGKLVRYLEGMIQVLSAG